MTGIFPSFRRLLENIGNLAPWLGTMDSVSGVMEHDLRILTLESRLDKLICEGGTNKVCICQKSNHHDGPEPSW